MRDIVGIFDMDNTTVTGITKKLLDRAEKEKKVFYATYDLPKTYIITVRKGKELIYVSQLAASTLKKRRRRPMKAVSCTSSKSIR